MDGPDRRAMESSRTHPDGGPGTRRRTRPSLEGAAERAQRRAVDCAEGNTLARLATPIRAVPNHPSTLPELGAFWSYRKDTPGTGQAPQGCRGIGSQRVFCGRDIRSGQKRGRLVGKTKRGKGTKIMGIADGHGVPLALRTESASPAEVKVVEKTMEARIVPDGPERLIGDKAYDSDRLDQKLMENYGNELIAPNKGNRRTPPQDGRPLRRYRKRWK